MNTAGGVRPGSRDDYDELASLRRASAREDHEHARDQATADRAQRLAELRALPVWADLMDLTEALYATYVEDAKHKTGDARTEAIGAQKGIEEWWKRLGGGETLGRAAMRRILARQYGGDVAEMLTTKR